MAKKQQSSKRKVVAFSVKGWNTAHYSHTEQYAKMVETLFRRAEADIVFGVANVNPDAGKVFSFDDYPGAKRMVAKTISELTANVTTVISKGSRKEWLFACQKNDAFLASILDTTKMSSKRLASMQDRNLDGLKAFQERKVDGMDLSKRVWKYTDQFKDQLELALDAGLGEGKSADQLSRDVRQSLKDPNRLFRRVRDKHGNLVLSKAAKAFHPGQGVYRSSYKNAMRLTRSEINMAYREADWQRWQQLDFVVGIEIHRSKNIKCDCPLCDRLAGKYPKTFKFKGWHPQCMCYVTPVLMDDETFNQNELADLKAALRGTQAKHFQSKDAVTDVPDGFKDWVKDNLDSQKYWKNTPYFVRDNFVSGDLSKGLKPLMTAIRPGIEPAIESRVPYEELDQSAKVLWERFKMDFYPMLWEWESACHFNEVPGIDLYAQHLKEAVQKNEWWRESELRAEYTKVDEALKSKIADFKFMAERGIQEFESVAKDAGEWLGSFDAAIRQNHEYMANEAKEQFPNYKSVVNSMEHGSLNVAKLRERIQKAKDNYRNAIDKANAAIAKYGKDNDVSKLVSLTKAQRTALHNAEVITKEIELEIANVEANANAVRVTCPPELQIGADYLLGEDYEFSPEFFALLDPKKPVKLIIKNDDSGSYENGGNKVVLANEKRAKDSKWEKKSVVYHEFGHAVGDQRRIPYGDDKEFLEMRSRQSKALKAKTKMTYKARSYDYSKGKYVVQTYQARSLVQAIDKKLERLSSAAWRWDNDVCLRRWGYSKHDIIEMVCSTRDTIKSLVPSYGDGHSDSYFRTPGLKEHEYLAHCFENAFLGNPIFKMYMPDIYNEMVAYIRTLKPAK